MSGASVRGVTKGDAPPVLTIGTSRDDRVKDFDLDVDTAAAAPFASPPPLALSPLALSSGVDSGNREE